MNVDLFTPTGEKSATMELPIALFGAPIRPHLMHQMLVLQQSNRRTSTVHVKTRGEVVGSTKKIVPQKHTGGARHGPVRSPTMRGGGKTFGPRNDRNHTKRMPRTMRRAAICSCLSYQAKQGAILGLTDYPQTIKTKNIYTLLKKLPVTQGRPVLFVTAGAHKGLQLSTRNLPTVKTLNASYLNPEDILHARSVIFLKDAVKRAEEVFAK